jgi:hypothetical protein
MKRVTIAASVALLFVAIVQAQEARGPNKKVATLPSILATAREAGGQGHLRPERPILKAQAEGLGTQARSRRISALKGPFGSEGSLANGPFYEDRRVVKRFPRIFCHDDSNSFAVDTYPERGLLREQREASLGSRGRQ